MTPSFLAHLPFGNMSGQMRNFLDQTGGLWAKGALVGKVASVFSSTGTGGGQEMTITSTWTTLAHHGMIIVPIGYSTPALFDISQVSGGTPYGATTIAGGDGSRQPDSRELDIARHQGKYLSRDCAEAQVLIDKCAYYLCNMRIYQCNEYCHRYK